MDLKLLPLATRVLTGEASRAEQDRLTVLLKDVKHRAWFERLRQRWEAAAPEPVGGFDAKDAARRIGTVNRTKLASTGRQRATVTRRRKPS